MFDDYVKVRKSEVKILEKSIDDALNALKTLHARNEILEKETEMLVTENKFLKGLVEKLATPARTYPETFKLPEQWPVPGKQFTLSNSCDVCGLSGINGYVCQNNKCPTKVSCTT